MLYACVCFGRRTFLPTGYPSSVRKEYMEYQTWDTVQVRTELLRCGYSMACDRTGLLRLLSASVFVASAPAHRSRQQSGCWRVYCVVAVYNRVT